MPSFGIKSKEHRDTCHYYIKVVLDEAIKIIDFSVLEGNRLESRQKRLFKEGKSKCDGIINKSKHQTIPSLAVDIAPYPIDFSDAEKARARFYHLMGVIKAIAHTKGIEFRFGMDWDGDNTYTDQSFDDLQHLEIII